MTKFDRSSRAWRAVAARFRTECEAVNAACWMCGQPVLYDEDATSHPDSFHPDHFLPVSTHPELALDVGNLRASHRSCNIARGNGPPPLGLGTPSRVW